MDLDDDWDWAGESGFDRDADVGVDDAALLSGEVAESVQVGQTPAPAPVVPVPVPAAPAKKRVKKKKKKKPAQPLNFASPDFDPLLALTTEGVVPPVADAPPLDYLAKCRVLLPEEHEDYHSALPPRTRATASRNVVTSDKKPKARLVDRFTTKFRAPPALPVGHSTEFDVAKASAFGRQRLPRTKTKSAPKAPVRGPMHLLTSLFERKAKVKVWIRRWKGLRGTCVGYLKAYDKHFNLVLLDVDEVRAKCVVAKPLLGNCNAVCVDLSIPTQLLSPAPGLYGIRLADCARRDRYPKGEGQGGHGMARSTCSAVRRPGDPEDTTL